MEIMSFQVGNCKTETEGPSLSLDTGIKSINIYFFYQHNTSRTHQVSYTSYRLTFPLNCNSTNVKHSHLLGNEDKSETT